MPFLRWLGRGAQAVLNLLWFDVFVPLVRALVDVLALFVRRIALFGVPVLVFLGMFAYYPELAKTSIAYVAFFVIFGLVLRQWFKAVFGGSKKKKKKSS